jgi:putative tricarboxylic transport membrane protein
MDEKLLHKPRLPGELGFALAMLLFGLTALWLSYRISGFSSWSSAGSVPLGTSFFLSASAVMIVIRTLNKPPLQVSADNSVTRQFYEKIFPMRHILFTAVIVLYMILLEPLGFITSSFLYLLASSLVLGERRYMHMVVVNVLSLAVVYLVFQTAFSVVLPIGPIERLFQ